MVREVEEDTKTMLEEVVVDEVVVSQNVSTPH
jgi:hypothetical protein